MAAVICVTRYDGIPTRRPTGTHHTRLVALTLLVAVVAACGTSSTSQDADDEVADTTTTSEATSAVEPEQGTTTTVTAEGPQEWVDVVRDLYEADFVLMQDPYPKAVQDLYSPLCACYQDRYGTVEFLATEGVHVEGQAINVLFVKHWQTDHKWGWVDLTVKIHANPLRIVDADGNEVRSLPVESGPSCVALTLAPDGPNGAYRIHTELPLTGCPTGLSR